MRTQLLVDARRAAEAAVETMDEGPLKVAAFETILAALLDKELRSTVHLRERPAIPRKSKVGRGAGAGTTARLVALVEDGIFAQQRSLAQIRDLLAERGWHYRLEDLGTPVTRLVRRKLLRRAQVSNGGKKIWSYSTY